MTSHKDFIRRFLFRGTNVRGEYIRLTNSYQTIINQHPYPAALRSLLGESLAVTCLLTATIKISGRLSVQFQGKDPLKLMLTQCNQAFQIRGLADWKGDLSEHAIQSALQKGTLAVIINADSMSQPYQGMVQWKGNSFTHSIEAYFQHSEQLPTRLWLSVTKKEVTGLMLQMMPHQHRIAEEENNDWQHLLHLTETITQTELQSLDHETILHRLYSQETVELFTPQFITFGCTCSNERSANAILMMREEEIEEELQENKQIIVTCEFCNSEYVFERADIARLLKSKNAKH